MREYVNSTNQASAAVARIVALVQADAVEPLVGIDLETSPLSGLTHYPGTVFDEAGERISPKKKHYLEYAQQKWRESFDPAQLAHLGLFVPSKTTNGHESKGVPAKAAWQLLFDRLGELERTGELVSALEDCRWTLNRLKVAQLANVERCEELLAARKKLLEQQAIKPLKKNEKILTGYEAELISCETYAKFLADVAAPRSAAPVDVRLLVHIVRVGVEARRIKADPVQPGLDPYTSEIFLVQFTLKCRSGELLSWVFNVQKFDIELLRPLLRLKKVRYAGANLKFDLKHLLHTLHEAPKRVYCTRVGSRMLYLGLKNVQHSLAACCERYIGRKLSKEERNLFVGQRYEEPTEEMIAYSYTDTEVLPDLVAAQEKMAAERGQVELLDTFSRLSYPTAVTELLGFCIDADKWLEIAAQVVEKRDAVARELEQMLLPEGYAELLGASTEVQIEETDEEADSDDEDSEVDARPDAVIRISQRALVLERLRELVGEEVFRQTFPRDEKPSLGKDARELMETVYLRLYGKPHPFFGLYKRWAKLAKQASTYGRTFLWNVHPLTGRIHSSLGIAGTDTGRFTSAAPNVLNIPRPDEEENVDFRAAFVAPEGYVFANCDYSAMEQRIAADLTGDPVLIALFEADGDSHSVSAAMMYHVEQGPVADVQTRQEEVVEGSMRDTITKVTLPSSWTPIEVVNFIVKDRRFTRKDKKTGGEVPASLMELIEHNHKKTTRQNAKTVGLGKQFGMTKFGIARKKNIPLELAEKIENLYDGVYAGMKAAQDKTARMPFENYVEGEDGERFGYATAYNGLRRWFRLPNNPSRREYRPNWAGDAEFAVAQKRYRKECGAVEREAKNVGTQGGNAVVTAEAILLLMELGQAHRRRNEHTLEGRLGLGIFPFLSIYDELVVLSPADISERTANAVVEQAMIEPSEKYITRVPSKAEANALCNYWKKF